MVINKNIRIGAKLKLFLDKKRVYDRETYDDIIRRLIKRGGKR